MNAIILYVLHLYYEEQRREKQKIILLSRVGVQNKKHTLSEIGHPCLDDINDKSCAWCGLNSQQCLRNGILDNGNKCGYLSAYAPGANNMALDYCVGRGIHLISHHQQQA